MATKEKHVVAFVKNRDGYMLDNLPEEEKQMVWLWAFRKKILTMTMCDKAELALAKEGRL